MRSKQEFLPLVETRETSNAFNGPHPRLPYLDEMGSKDSSGRTAQGGSVLLEPKDGASEGGRGAFVCFVKPVEPERLLRLVHLLAPTADSSPSYANSVGPYIPGPL
jgi:hypothetical protein